MMPSSQSLRQKLSSLSLAESYRKSRDSLRSLPRRNISLVQHGDTPASAGNQLSHQSQDNDQIDEVLRRVIAQAGIDFETRPMIMITASQFPHPDQVSYDLLFTRMMLYLDLFVESDYTVVFLASGGRHTPPWNWVWKAYRGLSKKYRKNLKKLYIVHSTMFSKMLFSLAGAIVSPKFFRKIQYVPTLSALAENVPLTNLELPPAVYKENLKHEKEVILPNMRQQHSRAFGVSLDDLMGEYGISSGVPRVVKDCIYDLRLNGLESEGIFRRSPSSTLLKQLKEAYNRGQAVSLSSFGDPHIAAVLLKTFFRDLPHPVVPESLYPHIRKCPPTDDPSNRTSIEYIRGTLLPMLERRSPATLTVLSQVLHLLHDVSLRSSVNKMDTFNLATTFCPNLVSGSSVIQDTHMCAVVDAPTVFLPSDGGPTSPLVNHKSSTLGSVVKICIENYFDIFEEHHDRTVGDTMRPSISQSAELNGLFTNSPRTPAKECRSHQGSPSPLPVPSCLSTSPMSGQGADSDYEDSDEAMLVMPIEPFISPARNRDSASIQHQTSGFEHPPIMAYSSPSNPRRIHRFNESSSKTKTKSPTCPTGVADR